jgi:hypothetical protein
VSTFYWQSNKLFREFNEYVMSRACEDKEGLHYFCRAIKYCEECLLGRLTSIWESNFKNL